MTFELSILKAAGEDVPIGNRVEVRRPHLLNIGNHVAIDNGFYITTGAELRNHIHTEPFITVSGGEKGF